MTQSSKNRVISRTITVHK